jgi:hypothetical protein
MEQRSGKRRAIDAQVVIDCRPTALTRGRIKNVSVGGMYIKMRPLRGLRNDHVKLVLVRRENGVSRIYRLPAVVIRWTRDGAGLMFSELTPNAFYALLAILLADEQQRAGHRSPPDGKAPGKPGLSPLPKYDG